MSRPGATASGSLPLPPRTNAVALTLRHTSKCARCHPPNPEVSFRSLLWSLHHATTSLFLSVSPVSHPCHTAFLFPAKDAGEETIFDKIVSGAIPSDKVRGCVRQVWLRMAACRCVSPRVARSGWLVM